jgi:hypothetical protein
MSNKAKGKHKLTSKSRLFVREVAEALSQQVMIDGLRQFTVEGIVEAKWKIAGIATLMLHLGNNIAATECAFEAENMENLINNDNIRAEVWQNLKDALSEDNPDEENSK